METTQETIASCSYATQDTGKIPMVSADGDHEDASDNQLERAKLEEVALAPEHASNPRQHVSDEKDFLGDILKYLKQIDASLKKALPAEKTEEDTGVDSELLKAFFGRVRVWDSEKMISMIDAEPRLMLEISKWGQLEHNPRNDFRREVTHVECTVFELAVLLNSEEMVANMLRIAIREFGPSSRQLFDKFKGDGFALSALEIPSVWGNKCILKLLGNAENARHIDFNEIEYSPELVEAEKQDILARLLRILDGNLEATAEEAQIEEQRCFRVDGTWLPNRSRTLRSLLIGAGYYGWGRPYGISLGDENDLFVLHSIARVRCQSSLPRQELVIFFKAILKKICEALGRRYTTRLMELRNHCGRTPVHELCLRATEADFVIGFLDVMTSYCDEDFDIFSVRDSANRNCLQLAIAVASAEHSTVPLEAFAKFAADGFGAALGPRVFELAVMHNQTESVKILAPHGDPRTLFSLGFEMRMEGDFIDRKEFLGIFQMAGMEGQVQILKTLLEEDMVWDTGLINPRPSDFLKLRGLDTFHMPALHLAAHSGNPLAVKTLLDSGKFNLFAVDRYGDTALHSVASSKLLKMSWSCIRAADFVDPTAYFQAKTRNPAAFDPDSQKKNFGGIIGCMDLLMQAGLDMDVLNARGETPQLISSAPDDLARWWYDKLSSQNQEAKKNLVAAANAISVTAALVATASFAGPLQPPLGLSPSTEAWLSGYSQVNHTAVQVFLFCDSLSFYLAIASIMLAVIPSLTIEKEALPLEVRIASRVVQVAVILLLASITFVIFAFSAASIAIVLESRWHYKALAVVTIIMGGMFCLLALCLFLLRLPKLIKPQHNNWVAKLTDYIFPQKRKKENSQLH